MILKPFLLALSLLIPTVAMADDAPQPIAPSIDQATVLTLLDQSADWYKAQQGAETLAIDQREISLKNSMKHNGEQALRQAIAFGHAEAAYADALKEQADLPPLPVPPPVEGEKKNTGGLNLEALQQASAATDKHLADVQASLRDTNAKLRTVTTARARATLTATRDKQQSELNLTKTQSELLKTIVSLLTGTNNLSKDNLDTRIGDYEKMLPDNTPDTSKKTATTTTAAATVPDSIDDSSRSIFGLTGQVFDLARKKTRIDDLGHQSNAMRDQVQKMLGQLRDELRTAAQQGRALAQSSNADAAQLDIQRRQLDALVVRFRLLAAAVPPLAEQTMWIEASQRNLADWAKLVDTASTAKLRALAIRALILVLAILIPVVLSRLAHRAAVKYVHDERRLRQLRFVRRALVTAAIVLIVTMNFFSEFGSLATYAGLLTAGLAVALQNVILSIVAHFFFVGRFGVRIGDRVTVGDVTGDIVEIGLVRFYLMEIDGNSRELHPTGRIVAFPNSILFQQSAFFKQIPGTHYAWHRVTVLLSANSDYHQAQEVLMNVVRGVLADYTDSMKQQQYILERSTRLKITLPQPEGRLSFVDAGIAFEGRYPVELSRASEIDERIMRGLLDAINGSEVLRLAAAAPPQIETQEK